MKQPVAGRVWLTYSGLHGDEQADRQQPSLADNRRRPEQRGLDRSCQAASDTPLEQAKQRRAQLAA